MLFGQDFTGKPVKIASIIHEGGVIVCGEVISVDSRQLRSGKILFQFALTDFTDSICVKLFLNQQQADLLDKRIMKDFFLMIKGVTEYDRYDIKCI